MPDRRCQGDEKKLTKNLLVAGKLLATTLFLGPSFYPIFSMYKYKYCIRNGLIICYCWSKKNSHVKNSIQNKHQTVA